MVHPSPATNCPILDRENISVPSFLSFLICKMGLGITSLCPHNFGKGSASPHVKGAQGISDLNFLSSRCVPGTGVLLARTGEGGMAGYDRVSPPAGAPGPTGSSKLGNLGFRQIQNNIIAVMSKGSRSADVPRLQRGGSFRPGWRAPFPHPGTLREEQHSPPPAPPWDPAASASAPMERLGSGFPSNSRPPSFLVFISFCSAFSLPPPLSVPEFPLSPGSAHRRRSISVCRTRAARWCG